MGRFITRDSWQGDYSKPLSFNRWMYVEGNPVNYTDPTGRFIHPECSYNPSENIEYIEKKASDFLSKSNWLDTYTAAGIAVQCWAVWIPNNDDYDGRGPAQITNAQTYTDWGKVITDASEDIRGYGLLCYIIKRSIPQYRTVISCTVCEDKAYMDQNYGVGNYQRENPHNQTEWRWAVEYMRRTIKLVLDACEARNCLDTDKFIAAALGQNGPGFNRVNMKNEVYRLDNPMPTYRLDWKEYFQRDRSLFNFKVNTRIQLSRFNQAILALKARNWFVPNRDTDYINQLIAGEYQ